jgi:hypothetical protein
MKNFEIVSRKNFNSVSAHCRFTPNPVRELAIRSAVAACLRRHEPIATAGLHTNALVAVGSQYLKGDRDVFL